MNEKLERERGWQNRWRDRVVSWLRLRPLFLPVLLGCAAILAVEFSSLLIGGVLLALVFATLAVQRRIFFLSVFVVVLLGLIHLLQKSRLDDLTEEYRFAKETAVEGVVVEVLNGGLSFIKVSGGDLPVGSKFLNLSRREHELGDMVEGKLWLRRPQPMRNPGGFDARKWLRTKGVIMEGKGQLEVVGKDGWYGFLGHFSKLKEGVKERLTEGIEGEDSAKVIQSMFLGERFGKEDPVAQDFRLSGAMHVFAVSGLHVMMVAFIAMCFLGLMPLPRWVVIPTVILLMAVYTGVTGWGTPAVRATVMGGLFLSGALFYRKATILNSLAASSLAVLAWDSYQLFTTGFQLTYVVVLSIVAFTKFWERRFAFVGKNEPFLPYSLYTQWQRFSLWTRTWLKGSLAVSFSAWMGSTPLIMIYFKLFSPIALLVGVPVVFLLGCVMWLSFSSLLVGSFSSSAAVPVNRLNGKLAEMAHKVAETAADVKYGHYLLASQPKESIEILDVKGGGAVYLNLGKGLMLDTGSDASKREVRDAMREFRRGVGEIWISHQDGGHYRGLEIITSEHPVDQVKFPSIEPSPTFAQVLKNVEQSGVELGSLRKGNLLQGEGYKVEVIYDGVAAKAADADDRAAVVKVNWHDHAFLFINDIGFFSEKEMLENGVDLSCDVLICGKHQDQQSPGEDFLRSASPKVVIATNFQYSFTEQRFHNWITMVDDMGIKLFNQSQTGAVSIRKSGDGLYFKTMLSEGFTLK